MVIFSFKLFPFKKLVIANSPLCMAPNCPNFNYHKALPKFLTHKIMKYF